MSNPRKTLPAIMVDAWVYETLEKEAERINQEIRKSSAWSGRTWTLADQAEAALMRDAAKLIQRELLVVKPPRHG